MASYKISDMLRSHQLVIIWPVCNFHELFVVVVLADHHWFTFLAVLVMMLDELCLNYVTLVDPQIDY